MSDGPSCGFVIRQGDFAAGPRDLAQPTHLLERAIEMDRRQPKASAMVSCVSGIAKRPSCAEPLASRRSKKFEQQIDQPLVCAQTTKARYLRGQASFTERPS